MSGSHAPTWQVNDRRFSARPAAWLAVLSLLLQALLPAAVSIAAPSPGRVSTAICGAPSHTGTGGNPAPDRPIAPPTLCCVLCLSAAIATGPLPQSAEIVPPPPVPHRQHVRDQVDFAFREPRSAAQPRGPPAA